MLRPSNAPLLIAAGLFGIAGYEMALRVLSTSFLSLDFVHGLWFGLCIGLEILGLIALTRNARGMRA